MKLVLGTTRTVLLTRSYAIKFARIRPIRRILQLVRRSRAGTVSSGLAQFDDSKAAAALKYFFGGIVSNLAEARLSRECPEEADVAPTLFSFLGLVNVQPRGEAVGPADLPDCPFRELAQRPDIVREFADFNQHEQFARFGSRILLIDAGTPSVARYLAGRRKRGLAFAAAAAF